MSPANHNYMVDIVALGCLATAGYAYHMGDLATANLVLGLVSGYYFGHRIKK